MAKEKVIKGKVDEGKHEGKRATIRREQAAEYELKEFKKWPWDRKEGDKNER